MQPPGVKFSRQNIYARDAYTCQYCGAKPPLSELTYDHVLPRALGGPTDWTNIVTCCLPCNRRKGGKRLEHSGLHLRRFPHKPTWHPHVAINRFTRHARELARISHLVRSQRQRVNAFFSHPAS